VVFPAPLGPSRPQTVSGSGDPARTIATLWGTRQLPRRGPKHTLTTARVIAAAVEIADGDQDLATLSMRRVAESLGVGTMSLYTYIASREELVEAMLDNAYGKRSSSWARSVTGRGRTVCGRSRR
jgi:AcrR family transcriptional regulator